MGGQGEQVFSDNYQHYFVFCIWFVSGGGIDSSLSLLSLFQNPVGGISGGGNIYNSGSSGGSIAIYPGQSGYNSYGAGKP